MDTETAKQKLKECQQRHQQLLTRLSSIGFIAQGSITQRYLTCGTKGCACHSDPSQRHGPYLYWTTKVQGKTVSKVLKGETAQLMQQWVNNRIELDSIIEQLREISLEALEPAVFLMQQESESTD